MIYLVLFLMLLTGFCCLLCIGCIQKVRELNAANTLLAAAIRSETKIREQIEANLLQIGDSTLKACEVIQAKVMELVGRVEKFERERPTHAEVKEFFARQIN